MQNLFLELTANAMDISVLTLLFTKRLPPKDNNLIFTLCFAIIGFILESVPTIFNINHYPTEVILIAFSIVFLYFFREGSVLHKLFWVAISFSLIFAIAFTVLPVVSYIVNADSDVIFNSFSNRVLYLAIVNIIKFTLFFLMSMRPQRIYNNYFPLLLCLFIPLVSVVSGTWLFGMSVNNEIETVPDKIIVLISISYLLINIVSFMLYEIIGKNAEKTFYLMAKENQYELMTQYTEQIKQHNKEIRIWQHDMKHHLSCLHTLIKKENYIGASEYLERFIDSAQASYLRVNSGNYIADAILSAKFDSATSKGIKVESEVSLPESFSVGEVDFCSILSNILDNAVEACQKVMDYPYINCYIVTIRNQLIISVENSSSGKYIYQNGIYKTQKKEGIHGIGLRHTQSIVNKYGGICSIEAKDNVFKIEISIPLK